MKSAGRDANRLWKTGLFLYGCMLALWLFPVESARAHKVTVFAWVEGDTVYTESKFSGGKKVKGGDITVYDEQGNRLLQGKTDEEGGFSFKIPKRAALDIVLETGMGHRGHWTIPVEDIQGMEAPQSVSPIARESAVSAPEPGGEPARRSALTTEDVQIAVEKAMDRRLKPILKMLAQNRVQGVTVKDIFGGIGYILGLMGVAAYVHYRKRTGRSEHKEMK